MWFAGALAAPLLRTCRGKGHAGKILATRDKSQQTGPADLFSPVWVRWVKALTGLLAWYPPTMMAEGLLADVRVSKQEKSLFGATLRNE